MAARRRIEEDRIAKVPVARLEAADVDAWQSRLRRAGVGEGSIRNQLQTLRSALAQAVRWGWISHNPAAQASSARPKRTSRGSMSPAEVRAVFAAAEQVHDMAPIAPRLTAVTGARRAELAALRWDDPRRATAHRRQRARGRRRPRRTRGARRPNQDRRSSPGPPRRRHAHAPRHPPRRVPSAGPVDVLRTADPPNPGRIGWWWTRARDLSGIERTWRLHDLRHWSATEGLGMGYDLPMVSGRLGHTDPSTTLRVYAHAVAGRDAELAASLGALLDAGSDT